MVVMIKVIKMSDDFKLSQLREKRLFVKNLNISILNIASYIFILDIQEMHLYEQRTTLEFHK